ncbi:hypothetical protein MMC09_001045 [Bachmanniomyces sp. S44760]|nr:hypothetical protein [Bachmanniomyces sp. S44760]
MLALDNNNGPPHPAKKSARRSTSNTPNASTSQRPLKTALILIEEISEVFHAQILPLCVKFTKEPPSDAKVRELEHRKLTEMILARVLIRLDGVQTKGDEEAKGRRKDLVKETQTVLNGLDRVGYI